MPTNWDSSSEVLNHLFEDSVPTLHCSMLTFTVALNFVLLYRKLLVFYCISGIILCSIPLFKQELSFCFILFSYFVVYKNFDMSRTEFLYINHVSYFLFLDGWNIHCTQCEYMYIPLLTVIGVIAFIEFLTLSECCVSPFVCFCVSCFILLLVCTV
jgi:hypothetical protein